ncbi:MAG: putative Ca-activated chloride channel family protein [Streblomastix strix]|uniref:Putative Ca-activated chloride channel family protein n=1 Tax=Streblomastix strix TaxID=222440 RepID=A0A5J4VNT9_9EUKA|nr:MAG: putative Ca-activated chloride channel family protein [Streblomastix strix]
MTQWTVEVKWDGQEIIKEELLQVFTPLGAIDVILEEKNLRNDEFCAFVKFLTQHEAQRAQDETDGLVLNSTVLEATICQFQPAPVPNPAINSHKDNINFNDVQINQNLDYIKVAADYGVYSVPRAGEVVVNVLLTFKGPKAPEQKERPPVTVALVIDKSGSMRDAKKMDFAKIAGVSLVQKLEPRDKLSVVTFDYSANVLIPMASVTNKDRLIQQINSIYADGGTDIPAGLEAGLGQIEGTKIDGQKLEGTKRIICLSDGQTSYAERVEPIVSSAHQRGISTSSVGLGLDYNETLMQNMAQRGGGQYYYCGEAADLPKVFDAELLLAKNAVTFRTSAQLTSNVCVREVKIQGLTTRKQGNETQMDVGDLTSEEERQILIQLTVDPSNQQKKKEEQTKDGSDIESTNLDLGKFKFQFCRNEESAAEQIEIPIQIQVDDNEDRRDSVNGDETLTSDAIGSIGSGGRSHVQSIEKVAEFVMNVEANAARTRAVEEMERGNEVGARYILNAQRQRQYNFQQAAIYAPQQSMQNQQSMIYSYPSSSSSSSSSSIQSQQQQSRPSKQVSPGQAVAQFISSKPQEIVIPQQQRSSPPRNISNQQSNIFAPKQQQQFHGSSPTFGMPQMSMNQMMSQMSLISPGMPIGMSQQIPYMQQQQSIQIPQYPMMALRSPSNQSAQRQSPPRSMNSIQFMAPPMMQMQQQSQSIPQQYQQQQQQKQQQQIETIEKAPVIKQLDFEPQSSIQTSLNNALLEQQKQFDDIEEQMNNARGNQMMQTHLVKQNKQRSYAQAQGMSSNAAYASSVSRTSAMPNQPQQQFPSSIPYFPQQISSFIQVQQPLLLPNPNKIKTPPPAPEKVSTPPAQEKPVTPPKTKPLSNDDAYECHSDDRCYKTTNYANEYWVKHTEKYLKAKKEWEEKQRENPEKKIKEPRKPFMLWMLLFGVGTRKLLLGQVMFFISYATSKSFRFL